MTGGLSPGWPLLELLMRPVSRGSKDAALQQYPVSRRLPPQRRASVLSGAGGVAARPYTRAHERSRGRGAPLRRAVGRLSERARRRPENRRADPPLQLVKIGRAHV